MRTSFDGINFEWMTEAGINRLLIYCSDIGNLENVDKEVLTKSLKDAIISIVNGDQND